MKDRLLPVKYFILILYSIIILVPLIIIFFGAFKTAGDLSNNPFGFPKHIALDNFAKAFVKGNMLIFFRNTIFISVISIAIITILSALAAYAITRINFKYGNAIYYLFMIGLTIPVQSIMIPSYLLMGKLHLVNNIWSLVIVYVSSCMSFSIFILSGFFRTIPLEVEEAALIDGCSEFKTFTKIILPLGKPALTTIIIFNLLTIWNDFYNPLLYIRDDNIKTLSLGLAKYMGRYVSNYPTMFAAVVISSIPIIMVFLALQKQFVAGITAGAVKG